MGWKELPRALQLYIAFLTFAGIAAVVGPISDFQGFTFSVALLVYATMAVLTSRFNVKIPYTEVHFSMDTAFIYGIIMLFGALPAMAVDAFCKFIGTYPHASRRVWYKYPFNIASGLVSVFAAAYVYQFLLPPEPHFHQYILPLLAMTLSYFLVNSWSVAIAISIQTKLNLIKLWIDNFFWTGIGFFVSLSISILLYMLHSAVGMLGVLVSAPILLLVYFSQRVQEKREEEQKEHIDELEMMHMSTLETLSLAIDAKDQTTHGHVHRVTVYVTKLAEIMGVEDPKVLKGLRFAALVHDIGKIAIPDMILSKPGRFTKEEFDRMKIHPIVGAQILKAVSFDFPIADVVLSHHERWDGSGYPHQLKGEQIDRHSRMLAVCDVYDALRSDRPYRSAMNKDKAISILQEERGKGFDPEIVDAFIENLPLLEDAVTEETRRIEELTFSTPSSTDPYAFNAESNAWQLYSHISYSQLEMHLLYDVAQMVSKSMSVEDICASLVTGVAKLIPYNTAVVFLASKLERKLQPVYIESRSPQSFREWSVGFGDGVSGWVAQNGRPMRNVSPDLELGDLEISDQTYLSALSVPIVFDEKPLGVVTLYSEKADFYQDNHQDLLVRLANMITPALVNALKYADSFEDEIIDELTGFGTLRAMRQFFGQNLINREPDKTYTLCLADLRELKKINAKHGHEFGDRVLLEVSRGIESVLRPEDRCFRYGGDEFVIIADGASRRAAQVLIDRIQTAIQRLSIKVPDGLVQPTISLGWASFPEDGITPEELLRVADGHMYKNRLAVNKQASSERKAEG